MAKHRKPNPQQHVLFANDSESIKEAALKRLREHRDEFRERARDNERKRRVLENTRKAEDWDEIKRACNPIRGTR